MHGKRSQHLSDESQSAASSWGPLRALCEMPNCVGAVALNPTWKLKKTLNRERPQTPGPLSHTHVRGRLWLASR